MVAPILIVRQVYIIAHRRNTIDRLSTSAPSPRRASCTIQQELDVHGPVPLWLDPQLL